MYMKLILLQGGITIYNKAAPISKGAVILCLQDISTI